MYHVKIDCILMEIHWSKLLEKLFEFSHIDRSCKASNSFGGHRGQLHTAYHGQRPITNFQLPRLYGVVIN